MRMPELSSEQHDRPGPVKKAKSRGFWLSPGGSLRHACGQAWGPLGPWEGGPESPQITGEPNGPHTAGPGKEPVLEKQSEEAKKAKRSRPAQMWLRRRPDTRLIWSPGRSGLRRQLPLEPWSVLALTSR